MYPGSSEDLLSPYFRWSSEQDLQDTKGTQVKEGEATSNNRTIKGNHKILLKRLAVPISEHRIVSAMVEALCYCSCKVTASLPKAPPPHPRVLLLLWPQATPTTEAGLAVCSCALRWTSLGTTVTSNVKTEKV